MATLTVWVFDDADSAPRAERDLAAVAARDSLAIEDGAVLTWPAARSRPRTRQLRGIALTSAVGGAFWGILFGIAFFMPTLGPLAGSDAGALSGALRGVGIEEELVGGLREALVSGTSALFILSSSAVAAAAGTAFAPLEPRPLRAELSGDQHRALRTVFAG
jgi:uncharacterized membrane protein